MSALLSGALPFTGGSHGRPAASRSAWTSLPWRNPSPKVTLCASSWAGGISHRCQDRRSRQRRPPTAGGTLLDGGLISRYRVPPAGNPPDPVQGRPVARSRQPGPWRRVPLHRVCQS